MPKAIVDPHELRNFAATLSATVEHLRGKQSQVSQSFSSLHDHWRDKKYTDFNRVFADSMGQLNMFLNSADQYAGYLRKKAEKAERYLDGAY